MGHCFYDKGLRFECQGCNYCCASEPGYVFLSEADIGSLCSFLQMDRQKFIDTYCRIVDMGAFKMISLLEKDNFDCIFLCKQGCKVYDGRPKQCRTYPFWAHVLEDKDNWDKESLSCPGINKGKLYSKKEIEEMLVSRLENNPVILM